MCACDEQEGPAGISSNGQLTCTLVEGIFEVVTADDNDLLAASQEAKHALRRLRTVNASFLSNVDYVSLPCHFQCILSCQLQQLATLRARTLACQITSCFRWSGQVCALTAELERTLDTTVAAARSSIVRTSASSQAWVATKINGKTDVLGADMCTQASESSHTELPAPSQEMEQSVELVRLASCLPGILQFFWL